MHRILFEKTGNAVWISHLDLMRLFQRAFKRAGLPLTHTQGFNPRPSVSIALPMSVGVESHCELLDFDLECCEIPERTEMVQRLNDALVAGVRVLDAYDGGRKIRDLAYLRCDLTLEYDGGIPEDAEQSISELLGREEVLVTKKNKNGITEQNIAPMILECAYRRESCRELVLRMLICCQNPTLNPAQVVSAIEKYIPAYTPDFSRCCRLEVYDTQKEIFR